MDTKIYRCEGCNKEMNIADILINKVCLKCADKNHKNLI